MHPTLHTLSLIYNLIVDLADAENDGSPDLSEDDEEHQSSDDDEEDEEDVPELYLPGLTLPTMFLPIPNVRYPLFSSLTWWLSKSTLYYAATTTARPRFCTIRQTR